MSSSTHTLRAESSASLAIWVSTSWWSKRLHRNPDPNGRQIDLGP